MDLKGATDALTHRSYDADGFDFLIWQRGGTHQPTDDGLLLPAVKDDGQIIPPTYELIPLPAVHDTGLDGRVNLPTSYELLLPAVHDVDLKGAVNDAELEGGWFIPLL